MLGFNYKIWITESAELKVAEYMEVLNVNQCWDDIVIGYSSADGEEFMKFYADNTCKHPKELYTPGKTVISHFTPISRDLVEAYKQGKMTKEEWEKLCNDTRKVSRGITDGIIELLQGFGREIALLSERDEWCHICGAEASKLGKFEKKDEMFYLGDQVGYLGSAVTELVIE